MTNEVVSPKQQRSIEKRNKIIEAGFQLFNEKGYYHTTTVDIAKEAGVSTGIVYRYFPDKKAIFIEAMEQFYQRYYDQFIDKLHQISSPIEIKSFLSDAIEFIIMSHNDNKPVHEEVEAMAHYDSEISALFLKFEEYITNRIVDLLPSIGIITIHPHEKIHIIYNIIVSYGHEIVFNKQTCKDYNYMKQLIIDTCLFLLEQQE